MKLIPLALLLSLAPIAEASPLLTVQRVNYKPEKGLVYELVFNKETCQINVAAPFEVYYRDNRSKQRLPDFSSDSRDYFGPRLDAAKITPTQAALEFKAFDEIQKETGVRAEILARLDNSSGECLASAEITYGNQRYTLEHIDIKVTKFLGFPNGVEWVQLKGINAEGPVVDCVVGKCN